MSFEGKERPAERRKGKLIVKCHLKAKSGHPWLAEGRKGDLVVKCQLMAKSGPPNFVKATWSLGVTRPERAAILGLRNVVKATLALGPTPTLISGMLYFVKAPLSSRVYLNAKSAHRSLAERRKGDLVVKGLFDGK